ncbi:MAG: hypothetical protein OXB89_11430 [Anaerolineaceae bacterium]|nr:hypothetical protein [Anaerolineaceae bacterium]
MAPAPEEQQRSRHAATKADLILAAVIQATLSAIIAAVVGAAAA